MVHGLSQHCRPWLSKEVSWLSQHCSRDLKGHLVSCLSHFIQPTCWIMLDHVGIWELLFHLVFILCHWSFFLSLCPPGKRGWGLVCGAPSWFSLAALYSACWDLVGHRNEPMSHKLRTNWNSCGCSIGLSERQFKSVVDCWCPAFTASWGVKVKS